MGELLKQPPENADRITHAKALQLEMAIFQHSQGNPGELEELWAKAIKVLVPSLHPGRQNDFLKRTRKAVNRIINTRNRHPIVKKNIRQETRTNLLRLYDRLKEPIIDISEREALIPHLAEAILCKDWLYLVNDGGRPDKHGLSPDDPYDPNYDKWFSYLAYYALWKDENGNRRSTGLHEFDVLYGAVGDYLEQVDLTTLTPTQPYSPHNPYNDGTTLHDKLMRMIDVYNDQQEFTLGAPQRKVWEGRVQQYFAA